MEWLEKVSQEVSKPNHEFNFQASLSKTKKTMYGNVARRNYFNFKLARFRWTLLLRQFALRLVSLILIAIVVSLLMLCIVFSSQPCLLLSYHRFSLRFPLHSFPLNCSQMTYSSILLLFLISYSPFRLCKLLLSQFPSISSCFL